MADFLATLQDPRQLLFDFGRLLWNGFESFFNWSFSYSLGSHISLRETAQVLNRHRVLFLEHIRRVQIGHICRSRNLGHLKLGITLACQLSYIGAFQIELTLFLILGSILFVRPITTMSNGSSTFLTFATLISNLIQRMERILLGFLLQIDLEVLSIPAFRLLQSIIIIIKSCFHLIIGTATTPLFMLEFLWRKLCTLILVRSINIFVFDIFTIISA